ncbi:MAG TPA: hypothetical protein VMT19_00820 [Thermoanaerobaculaceae bacterium]|nr:hypothetical protein [Thermoanaerobaculaceae bacterium]
MRARRSVALVAVDMGYGHLRAAHALAGALDAPVLELDRPPLASGPEQRRWSRARAAYEALSRSSQLPAVGRPLRSLLEAITFIPHLYAARDQSRPTGGVRVLERLARRGLGRGLLEHLHREDATLVTTFYAPAVIADLLGYQRTVCVVTDTDVNRVWVGRWPAHSTVHYCVPSERALQRLLAFGVRREFVHLTGFPLPPELTGGPDLAVLRANLGRRLVRLDRRGAFRDQLREEVAHLLGALPAAEEDAPPLLTFAVGGAGAQLAIARSFLPSLRRPLERGELRLALVAGVRPEAAERFEQWALAAGLSAAPGGAVEVVREDSFAAYHTRFNALLARTDVLWTKPSELSFYAALGIPLVFSWPVGVHERANRRWVLHRGAGFKQERPADAWEWLREWLDDGTLAGAAWAGYQRLPKFGTARIAEVVDRVGGG